MIRRMVLALLCVVAVGCGGGGSSGNSAVSKQFSYGNEIPAGSYQQSAVQGSLSSALSLQSSPDVSGAMSVTEFSGVSGALLGSPSFSLTGATGSAQQKALVKARSAAIFSPTDYGAQFDDPNCVATSPTSVTLSNCTVTVTETSGGETIRAKATTNGSVTLTDANQTLTWDLTISVSVTVSDGSGSGGGRFHAGGTLTVTPPTATADGAINGKMTTEMSINASGGGESLSIGLDEALILDLTYRTSPSTCVTGGTIEAKRTWPQWSVPGSSPRPADEAALVTFTGCGAATIKLSI